ncbi:MAG: hypothetical protein KBC57_03165 [Neisseriaceae bacterium]|nr:hypothetical protein [Neisseriaceae bacterium]
MDCLPVMPDVVPCPLLNGYGYAPQNPFIRSQMDSGRARQRRRFKSVAKKASVSWLMTDEQLAIFESFFDYETCGGVGWFRLNLKNGLGMVCVKARFINPEEPYSVQKNNKFWTISAVLETFDMPRHDEQSYALIKDNEISKLTLLSRSLREVIHTDKNSPYWW